MTAKKPKAPEHIYLSVHELLTGENLLAVKDRTYQPGWREVFLPCVIDKIHQTDPGALFLTPQEKSRLAETGRIYTKGFGSSEGFYSFEYYNHVKGDGDRVAKALVKIFNYRADPGEPVAIKVSEQLNEDHCLAEILHPMYVAKEDLPKRHFDITVAGSLYDYMARHGYKAIQPS